MKKTSKRTGASLKPSRGRPRRPQPAEAALEAIAGLASRLGARWYVFGAQAVNLHGFPRATADLDVTIELGSRSVGSLMIELKRAGFEPRFADAEFVAATRVVPAVHRASRLPIDFVLAGPGLEERFLDEVELHRLGRRDIPVLSVENLIVTKLLAGRARDLEDVRELIALHAGTFDRTKIETLLEALEEALEQSDLRPLFGRLRTEASTRAPARRKARTRR